MRRRLGPIVAVALLSLGACDWRAFDELAGETWVQTHGMPDEMTSTDYGYGVAGVGASPTVGGGLSLYVAARSPAGLGALVVNDTGAEVSLTGVDAPMPLDRNSVPLSVAADATTIVVGAPEQMGGLLAFDPVTLGAGRQAALPAAFMTATGVGRSVALASLGMGDARLDIVSTAQGAIIFSPDLGMGTPIHCTTTLNPTAVAIGDYNNDNIQDVGVGMPDSTAAQAMVLNVAAVPNGGACAAAAIETLTLPASQGVALAMGNVDGMPGDEAIIGMNTPQLVHVKAAGMTGTDIMSHDLDPLVTFRAFGDKVAVADFDRDGIEEIVAADFSAVVDGRDSAGAAEVFSLNGQKTNILYQRDPDVQLKFGRNLSVAPFVTDAGTFPVLVVAAEDDVYLYYQTLTTGTDPRQ